VNVGDKKWISTRGIDLVEGTSRFIFVKGGMGD